MGICLGIVILLKPEAWSGFINSYIVIMVAGTPACRPAGITKTVTSLLIIPSVLVVRFLF